MYESEDERDPWHAEADAFGAGVESRDFDVAEAAELPDELEAHVEAADDDPDFEREFDEWRDHLLADDDQPLLLALEESCHLGVLMPWDMCSVRLATAPPATLAAFHRLIEACPRHVLVQLHGR